MMQVKFFVMSGQIALSPAQFEDSWLSLGNKDP
jgi:hypothetical protein